MNEQYVEHQFDSTEAVEETDMDTNSPEVNLGLFRETSPVDEVLVPEPPNGKTITHEAPVGMPAESSTPLLIREEAEHFRTRWNEIQGNFVDEPRAAVEQADGLVSEVIEQITQMFATEHHSLEDQWNQDNDVSTEDLRKALQHYRSFFNRLVV
jgi:hypothetical protein